MVGKTNAVTAREAYAYIKATYTAGLICTATNGTKTITAPNTLGVYVFGIPEPNQTPEIWTVNATNGSNTSSETVSITSRYQIETVSL